MQSGAVVEGFDVIEDGGAGVLEGGEALVIDHFIFEAAPKGLDEGVVVAVAFCGSWKRPDHAGRGPAGKRAHDEKEAGRLLSAGLARLGLTAEMVVSLKKSDPRKQALAWMVKTRSVVSDEWLVGQLRMGDRSNISRAISALENPETRDTGHYRHTASGLYLAPYRAYDPAIGRWISRDPIGEAGGLNLYAYVENNPINLVDPTGENWVLAVIAAIVFIAMLPAALLPPALQNPQPPGAIPPSNNCPVPRPPSEPPPISGNQPNLPIPINPGEPIPTGPPAPLPYAPYRHSNPGNPTQPFNPPRAPARGR